VKTLIQGKIIGLVPTFRAYIREGSIIFDSSGDIIITVDTGFDGGIMLPQIILDDMNLDFMGYDTFIIANGETIELPVFFGKSVVKGQEFETWFIPGDSLVGMEFFYEVGKGLKLDFEKFTVKLLG
jgi:predicted aspartyl protease